MGAEKWIPQSVSFQYSPGRISENWGYLNNCDGQYRVAKDYSHNVGDQLRHQCSVSFPYTYLKKSVWTKCHWDCNCIALSVKSDHIYLKKFYSWDFCIVHIDKNENYAK